MQRKCANVGVVGKKFSRAEGARNLSHGPPLAQILDPPLVWIDVWRLGGSGQERLAEKRRK